MKVSSYILYLIIVIITIIIKEIDSDSKDGIDFDIYQLPLKPREESSSDNDHNQSNDEGGSWGSSPSIPPTRSPNYISPTNNIPSISPSQNPTRIETKLPTPLPSMITISPSQNPTRIETILPTLIPSISKSPTPLPSMITKSPSQNPTRIETILPTLMPSISKSPTPLPSMITKSPSKNPTRIETILIAEMMSFEFYIYNTTINNKSNNVISNAVSKDILQTNRTFNVSIDDNVYSKRYMKSRRTLIMIDDLNRVLLIMMTPFRNIFGEIIDSKTANSKLANSISNGNMQQSLRSANESSLKWVVVCHDESCSNKDNNIANYKLKEPCSESVSTVYDKYYGYYGNQKLEGYVLWLIFLIIIWFGICAITVCALFSRYYYDFNRLYDIKCYTSFCRRSNRTTLQSILETSKFITGCLVFNCAITRLWSLLMIIILTMKNLGVTNFACAEFSIIKSNADEFSKVYVLVYAIFYPILILAIVGRQIWHESEMRNVGFIHLMSDARMHLAISIILRKVAVVIGIFCLVLLLTLLISTFAISSSKIIVIIQSVQLVCAIFILIIQCYRVYGIRNIRLEIRSPLDLSDSFTNLNPNNRHGSFRASINNPGKPNNKFYISSSLDDSKDDDYLDGVESADSSEMEEQTTYRPQVSDNLSILFSIITAILSIVTAVPYLFDKALLSFIVFSIITRIFEIFTVCSLISTFKISSMSLQQFITRELKEAKRNFNSSLPSSIKNLYRSSSADFQEKEYMYEVNNDMNPFRNDADSQSLISDITFNTKQPSYTQLNYEQEHTMMHNNETIVEFKNENKKVLAEIDDDTPKWIKKWEQSGSHRKMEIYDTLNNHLPDFEKVKVDKDVFLSDSTASSFGSHWKNMIDIVKNDIDSPKRNNTSLVRTRKLEI